MTSCSGLVGQQASAMSSAAACRPRPRFQPVLGAAALAPRNHHRQPQQPPRLQCPAATSSSSDSSTHSTTSAAAAEAAAQRYGWSFQQQQKQQDDPRVQDVPVAAIRRPLGRTRANDQAKVEALMESIREIGLQEPIDVLLVDGQFYGFSGCHRYEAHQRLGLPTIRCRVRKANQQVLRMHMM